MSEVVKEAIKNSFEFEYPGPYKILRRFDQLFSRFSLGAILNITAYWGQGCTQ